MDSAVAVQTGVLPSGRGLPALPEAPGAVGQRRTPAARLDRANRRGYLVAQERAGRGPTAPVAHGTDEGKQGCKRKPVLRSPVPLRPPCGRRWITSPRSGAIVI